MLRLLVRDSKDQAAHASMNQKQQGKFSVALMSLAIGMDMNLRFYLRKLNQIIIIYISMDTT